MSCNGKQSIGHPPLHVKAARAREKAASHDFFRLRSQHVGSAGDAVSQTERVLHVRADRKSRLIQLLAGAAACLEGGEKRGEKKRVASGNSIGLVAARNACDAVH